MKKIIYLMFFAMVFSCCKKRDEFLYFTGVSLGEGAVKCIYESKDKKVKIYELLKEPKEIEVDIIRKNALRKVDEISITLDSTYKLNFHSCYYEGLSKSSTCSIICGEADDGRYIIAIDDF